VLNIIAGYETCSFLNKYFRYHQIHIAQIDIYKTTFVTDWGGFIWKVMLFGINNELLTYQKVATKAFIEHLDIFMMIFLDDFIVYSDMENHL
jgi:hypothetical protein